MPQISRLSISCPIPWFDITIDFSNKSLKNKIKITTLTKHKFYRKCGILHFVKIVAVIEKNLKRSSNVLRIFLLNWNMVENS